MRPQFTLQRRVHFSETDMAGIVHFSNYNRYMEETEHAFFHSLGLHIMEREPDGTWLGWPRVRCSCSFESPAFYDDLLDIDLTIVRKGVKSLTLSFLFRRGETRVATGELKTVCCRWRPGETMASIEIPSPYQERLTEGEPL